MTPFHECELKFKLSNHEKKLETEKLLKQLGFKFSESRLERDYILDNANFSFRRRHGLFRIRKIIQAQKESILLTLKIKGNSQNFQDNLELETFIGAENGSANKDIVQYVKKEMNVLVPDDIFSMNQLPEILERFEEIGLVPYNIVEKERREFLGEHVKILFDTFPDPIGIYLEIEAGNEMDLFHVVEQLDLKNSNPDRRNYGQIIAEATNGKFKNLFFNED